jgi:hypothetical protein
MHLFGQCEQDLAVDFGQLLPLVTSEVLEACEALNKGCAGGRDFFWNLPVGKRIECLLKVTNWGRGGNIELNFACQNPGCKQALEIVLPVQELVELQSRTDGIDYLPFLYEGNRFVLRRPTGKDQLAWLAEGLADERQSVLAIARRLLLADKDGQEPDFTALGEDWIESAEKVLEEFDPLLGFRVDTVCPDCGVENRFEVDMEALCLQRLQRAQMDLLETVHTLAKHYHWSETQIFSVPAWRRAHYLRLIAKEDQR